MSVVSASLAFGLSRRRGRFKKGQAERRVAVDNLAGRGATPISDRSGYPAAFRVGLGLRAGARRVVGDVAPRFHVPRPSFPFVRMLENAAF